MQFFSIFNSILGFELIEQVIGLQDFHFLRSFDYGLQPQLNDCHIKVHVSLMELVGNIALFQAVEYVNQRLRPCFIDKIVKHRVLAHLEHNLMVLLSYCACLVGFIFLKFFVSHNVVII